MPFAFAPSPSEPTMNTERAAKLGLMALGVVLIVCALILFALALNGRWTPSQEGNGEEHSAELGDKTGAVVVIQRVVNETTDNENGKFGNNATPASNDANSSVVGEGDAKAEIAVHLRSGNEEIEKKMTLVREAGNLEIVHEEKKMEIVE